VADDDARLHPDLVDIGPQPQAQGLDAQQVDLRFRGGSQRASYFAEPGRLDQPGQEVGKPFDLGLSWTPEGKVDVMVKTGGREEHIYVTMKTAPTRVRVIASSGYWKLLPFEFGIMDTTVNPDPDALMLSGCPPPPPPPDEA
jgi:hypothetical protein